MSSAPHAADHPLVRTEEYWWRAGARIATIETGIAQTLSQAYIEPALEHLFHRLLGYRREQSALHSIGVTRERCWKYDVS